VARAAAPGRRRHSEHLRRRRPALDRLAPDLVDERRRRHQLEPIQGLVAAPAVGPEGDPHAGVAQVREAGDLVGEAEIRGSRRSAYAR
jgi:hypothetical protein